MPRHAELVADAVAAHHVACHAGNVERLAAAVALDDRSGFDSGRAFVLHAPQAQAPLQAQGNLGLHVGQLFLDQLVGGQGPAKLFAVQRVLARGVPAKLCRAQCSPGNAVARAVEAGERALQPLHVGEGVVFRHEHLVHHDLARHAGAQAHLAVDGGGREAFHTLVQDETANRPDAAALAHFLGPDHEHVRHRAVGDPHLAARKLVAARHLFRAAGHAAGVRSVVGFGQAEAANPFAAGQFGQVFLALRLGAEFKNRHHHQRALHAGHGAVARIDALDFTRNQPVGDVIEPRAAVLLGNGGAEQADFAHLAKDGGVHALVSERFQHARCQLVLAVGGGGISHHALVVAQLLVEQKGVVPMKSGVGHGGLRWVLGDWVDVQKTH